MKIGICAWSLPIEEIDAFKVAKEFGIDGVVLNFEEVSKSSEIRKAYMAEGKKYGIEIPTLALNRLCDSGMTKKENHPQVLELFHQAIEIAAEMGIDKIQVPSFGDNLILRDEDLENTIEIFNIICPLAEKKNILIGTESVMTIAQHQKFYESLTSSNITTLYDTQNPWRMMNQDGVAIAKYMLPFTGELHAKDSFLDGPQELYLGEGDVRFDEIMEIFANSDYDAWIQLESNYAEMKGYEYYLKKDIEILRDLFK